MITDILLSMQELADILDTFRTQMKREILKSYPSIDKFCLENDFDKGAFSRILNGKRNTASLRTLYKIAIAFGMEVEIRLKK